MCINKSFAIHLKLTQCCKLIILQLKTFLSRAVHDTLENMDT